jgi:hypothetical protein
MTFEARDLVIDLSAEKTPPPKPSCVPNTSITGGVAGDAATPPPAKLFAAGGQDRDELAMLKRQLRAALAAAAAEAMGAGAAPGGV